MCELRQSWSEAFRYSVISVVLVFTLLELEPRSEAQNTVDTRVSKIEEQYRLMKTVFQHYYDRGDLSQNLALHKNRFELAPARINTYYVTLCAGPPGHDLAGESLTKSNRDSDDLAALAGTIVAWQNDFTHLGYPKAFWENLINEYERSTLAGLSKVDTLGRDQVQLDEVADRLVIMLSHYRHRFNPSLPYLTRDTGCGAGDQIVTILAEPKDGRVYLISEFFYELCKAQGIDPFDTDRCSQWEEVVNQGIAFVAGRYYYLARWPDGAIRKGPINADKLLRSTGDFSNFTALFREKTPQTLVLQKAK
jgi:hypothetical protein